MSEQDFNNQNPCGAGDGDPGRSPDAHAMEGVLREFARTGDAGDDESFIEGVRSAIAGLATAARERSFVVEEEG